MQSSFSTLKSGLADRFDNFGETKMEVFPTDCRTCLAPLRLSASPDALLSGEVRFVSLNGELRSSS